MAVDWHTLIACFKAQDTSVVRCPLYQDDNDPLAKFERLRQGAPESWYDSPTTGADLDFFRLHRSNWVPGSGWKRAPMPFLMRERWLQVVRWRHRRTNGAWAGFSAGFELIR